MHGRLSRTAAPRPLPVRAQGKASQQSASSQRSLPLLLLPVVPLLLLLSALQHLPSRYTGIYLLSQSVKGRVGDWGRVYSDWTVELEALPELFYLVLPLVTY